MHNKQQPQLAPEVPAQAQPYQHGGQQQLAPPQQRWSNSNFNCYGCGQSGHIIRYCPSNRYPPRNDYNTAPAVEEPQTAAPEETVPKSMSTIAQIPSLPEDGKYTVEQVKEIVGAFGCIMALQAVSTPGAPLGKVDLTSVIRIEIMIEGINVKALVDGGATLTIMAPCLAKFIQQKFEHWALGSLALASGVPNEPKGAFRNLRLVLGTRALTMDVAVNTGDTYMLILGNDFLESMGVVTDHARKVIGPAEEMLNETQLELWNEHRKTAYVPYKWEPASTAETQLFRENKANGTRFEPNRTQKIASILAFQRIYYQQTRKSRKLRPRSSVLIDSVDDEESDVEPLEVPHTSIAQLSKSETAQQMLPGSLPLDQRYNRLYEQCRDKFYKNCPEDFESALDCDRDFRSNGGEGIRKEPLEQLMMAIHIAPKLNIHSPLEPAQHELTARPNQSEDADIYTTTPDVSSDEAQSDPEPEVSDNETTSRNRKESKDELTKWLLNQAQQAKQEAPQKLPTLRVKQNVVLLPFKATTVEMQSDLVSDIPFLITSATTLTDPKGTVEEDCLSRPESIDGHIISNAIRKEIDLSNRKLAQCEVQPGIISLTEPNIKIIVTNKTHSPLQLFRRARICALTPVPHTTVHLKPNTPFNPEVGNPLPPLAAISQPVLDLAAYRKEFKFGAHLTAEQQEKLFQLMVTYRDRFAIGDDELGRIKCTPMVIDTGDHPPIKQRPYRMSYWEQMEIEKQIDDMLKRGIISPSISAWGSPVVLVGKRDGATRFCTDYRATNKAIKDDSFPIPRLDEGLTILGGNILFSTLDVAKCYWQIPLDPATKEKTTFVCHKGAYMYNYVSFGLKTAPQFACRVLEEVFGSENRRTCYLYFDDIIVFSKGFDEHLVRLQRLLDLMREFDVKLKPSKCDFGKKSVAFLGHLVSESGIIPDPERTSKLNLWTIPQTPKDIKAFLGFTGFYRQFVLNYAKIAQPMTKLLRKNEPFNWTDHQQKAFETLREAVIRPEILAHYNPLAELELSCDSSSYGCGGHLSQLTQGKRQLLSCVSRLLSDAERNYGITEKEALAIVWSVAKLRHYLYGRKFTIITDHNALCSLMKNRKLTDDGL